MASHAAVGIDDDLASGKTGIAHRTAKDEGTGRVDQQGRVFGVVLLQAGVLDNPFKDLTAQGTFQPSTIDLGIVLRGNHHGIQVGRLIVVGVGKGHLGLAIRAEVIDDSFLTYLRQAAGQAVRQSDGQWHVLSGLIRGIAEHQTLVAGTCGIVFGVIILVMSASFSGVVHSGANFLGLLANGDIHATGVAIKADFRRSKADGLKGVAHQRRDFYVCLGANLAHHVDLAGGYQRLNGDAGCWILFQQGIKDGVRNGVTNLIGMAFCHGLAGKKTSCHCSVISHKNFLCSHC